MRTAGLNGRLTRLERAIAPPPQHQCRRCGLRHVQPLTIALLRSVLRVAGGGAGDAHGRSTPRTPLCLCACCTSDPRDRGFARLSYGLSPDEDAV
jgi:hypothetical protein